MRPQPIIGSRILHTLHHVAEAREGTVEYHLEGQFCYEDDSGHRWICHATDEDWKYVDAPKARVPSARLRPLPTHVPFTAKGEAMRVYRIDTEDRVVWVGTQEEANREVKKVGGVALAHPVEVPYKKSELLGFLNSLFGGGEADG